MLFVPSTLAARTVHIKYLRYHRFQRMSEIYPWTFDHFEIPSQSVRQLQSRWLRCEVNCGALQGSWWYRPHSLPKSLNKTLCKTNFDQSHIRAQPCTPRYHRVRYVMIGCVENHDPLGDSRIISQSTCNRSLDYVLAKDAQQMKLWNFVYQIKFQFLGWSRENVATWP